MTTKPKTTTSPKSQSHTLPTEPGANGSEPMPKQQDMQLIPVTEGEIGGVKGLVVDARQMHTNIGSARSFANWITYKIKTLGFLEDVDYIKNKNVFNSGRGRKDVEYTLALDMAKELAMVEKNDMGRAIRRYFIQCERDLMATSAPSSKALPAPKEHKSEFRDWEGKPYEKNAMNRHNLKLLTLFSVGPRKAAYSEYARSIAITGIDKKELAVDMAECVYNKTLSVNLRKFLEHPELRCDLHALKKMLEKEGVV